MRGKVILYLNGQDIAELSLGLLQTNHTWLSEPREFALNPENYLAGITDYLSQSEVNKTDLAGLAVAQGPGSATALRTSHALANTLAFALGIPVWSVPALEGRPADEVAELLSESAQPFALPAYAQAPKITPSGRDQLKRKTN